MNTNIHSIAGLSAAIEALENKKAEQRMALKVQYQVARESMKPVNILKSFFKKKENSGSWRDQLISATADIISGFISKKLVEAEPRTPLKKLIGSALIFGISNLVSVHPESLNNLGNKFLHVFQNSTTEEELITS